MDLSRTLILGNSGSGKSWLAERIAGHLCAACVDLDLIHWLPGGYNVAREQDEAITLVRQAAESERWIIEGIYGILVREVQASATALVWLCLDEAQCVANIRDRGIRRKGTTEGFSALMQWASTYRTRHGSSSYTAHEAIFNSFERDKAILPSREAIAKFAKLISV
ncbi:adenylate kinase [Cupriavidus necator]